MQCSVSSVHAAYSFKQARVSQAQLHSYDCDVEYEVAKAWHVSVHVSVVSSISRLKCCHDAACVSCSKRSKPESDWDAVEATPAAVNRWDATPGSALGGATPGPNSWDATPGGAAAAAAGGSRWDATPGAAVGGATPGTVRRNRWDETPAQVSKLQVACGLVGAAEGCTSGVLGNRAMPQGGSFVCVQ